MGASPRAPPWIRPCLVLQLSVKTNKFFEKIISVIHEENAKEIWMQSLVFLNLIKCDWGFIDPAGKNHQKTGA